MHLISTTLSICVSLHSFDEYYSTDPLSVAVQIKAHQAKRFSALWHRNVSLNGSLEAPEPRSAGLKSSLCRPQKRCCKPEGSKRPFARQLGGPEGAPMRFSREVLQKSEGSHLSGTHANQTGSSRKVVQATMHLISTT